MTTTAAQQNPENSMKNLDQPSDSNPAAESVFPTDSTSESPKSPPSAGAKEEIKASGGDDSCQVNDVQKKMKRAERFGTPVQLSEEEKRNSRAERFGTGSPVQGSDALKKSEEHKRQARAERFGLVKSATSDEEAKKKARLTRFAPPMKTDPVEEDKRKARALRFSQPQANGKGNIEQVCFCMHKQSIRFGRKEKKRSAIVMHLTVFTLIMLVLFVIKEADLV
ncbi:hypothetical protein HAX54_051783 [Datura stramonium]|uniref:THO1-MOS11 C-terminal domain-containing protein n=1 Tax=Datura stramonium TaxID=4076 RepID=A0ABS8SZ25_DATST|nr:hypothetical protein [Datura stramonium]